MQKHVKLLGLDLLIVDELGYMPVEGDGANLLFQLASRRYETGSIILTSNKPFAPWGEIFGDETIASAIWAGWSIILISFRSLVKVTESKIKWARKHELSST